MDCSCGGRHWGRFGAAGLLVLRDGAVLMQHRAPFLQEGGTWAVPGGALDVGESAVSAAFREAEEEAEVPPGAVRPRHAWAVDHGTWSYTTVVADATVPFEARDADGEGLAVRWVPVDMVDTLPLHSGFAASWSRVRELLTLREVVLVADDAAQAGLLPEPRATPDTVGLATPSPLLRDVPGRTLAWPSWEQAHHVARRALELVRQGWDVTVVSDDAGLQRGVAHPSVTVVGTRDALAGMPHQ